MEQSEILSKLDRELRNTAWKYKYWEEEGVFEFRNTGKTLTEAELKGKVNDILNEIKEEGGFKPLLAGKIGIMLEDDNLWKTTIDEKGYPKDKVERLEKEEARELIKKSIHRVDNDILISNRLVLDSDEILDIYSERSQGKKYINLTMEGNKRLIIDEDGGLEFST